MLMTTMSLVMEVVVEEVADLLPQRKRMMMLMLMLMKM